MTPEHEKGRIFDMAMLNSGGYGSRSYSYSVTKTYTLSEAVDKASRGELDPSEVYRQMPQPLKEEIDRISSASFKQPFSALSGSQEREVMRALKEEMDRANEEREKPVSLLEALRMGREGRIDAVKLYHALPTELREVIDSVAKETGLLDFCGANPEERGLILELLLEMIHQAEGGAAR